MNCGPLSLIYIHKRHGKRLTLNRARALAKTTRDGSGIEDMIDALNKMGYAAELRERTTWKDLTIWNKAGIDIIVDWWSTLYSQNPTLPDGHYCVVTRVTPDSISLYDPDPEEEINLPRQFFEANWYDYTYIEGKRRDWLRAAIIVQPKGILPHAK